MSKKIPGRRMLGENEYNIEENFDNLANWTISQTANTATVSVAGNKLTINNDGAADVVTMIHATPIYGSLFEILCHAKLTDFYSGGGYSNRARCFLFARSKVHLDRLDFGCGLHRHDGFHQIVWEVNKPAIDYGVNVSSPTQVSDDGYRDGIVNLESDDVSDGADWKPPAGTYRIGLWQRLKINANRDVSDDHALTQYFLNLMHNSTADQRLARALADTSVPGLGDWYRYHTGWSSGQVRDWFEGRGDNAAYIDPVREWEVGLKFWLRGDTENETTWEVQKFRARQL